MDDMKNFKERLLEATKGCREDMHEPDELNVIVTGTHLDNAMGDNPYNNCCELTVGIKRTEGTGEVTYWFNLATLIALARKADIR